MALRHASILGRHDAATVVCIDSLLERNPVAHLPLLTTNQSCRLCHVTVSP